MGYVDYFGHLLWPWVMGTMIVMISFRIVLFILSLVNTVLYGLDNSACASGPATGFSILRFYSALYQLSVILLRSFFPGHTVAIKRPIYILHMALFHICLLVSVFFLSFHVNIWKETLPQWVLSFLPDFMMPDAVLEYATLFVIYSVIYMVVKRLTLKDMRQHFKFFDLMLSLVVLVPFITGYYAMTGKETTIPFIDYHLDTIHIVSGEIFILTTCFLFCKTIIIKKRCVACLGCVNKCPTGALITQDIEDMRYIHYTVGNCIHCGTCISVCEDRASEFRHVLGIPWPGTQTELCSLKMFACKTCNTLFATQKHLEKLQQKNLDFDLDICPECRQFFHAEVQRKFIL